MHWEVRHKIPQTFHFSLQNGIEEEELGPVSLLLEGDGPCVPARLWEGSAADAGQEMLFQGERCVLSSLLSPRIRIRTNCFLLNQNVQLGVKQNPCLAGDTGRVDLRTRLFPRELSNRVEPWETDLGCHMQVTAKNAPTPDDAVSKLQSGSQWKERCIPPVSDTASGRWKLFKVQNLCCQSFIKVKRRRTGEQAWRRFKEESL